MSFVFVCWHKYQKYKSVELGDQLGGEGSLSIMIKQLMWGEGIKLQCIKLEGGQGTLWNHDVAITSRSRLAVRFLFSWGTNDKWTEGGLCSSSLSACCSISGYSPPPSSPSPLVPSQERVFVFCYENSDLVWSAHEILQISVGVYKNSFKVTHWLNLFGHPNKIWNETKNDHHWSRSNPIITKYVQPHICFGA